MAKVMKAPKRQLTYVTDLNKCIGCQTCTVACKNLWTTGPGQEYMYWRNVETSPGLGYPRNWQTKGGGYKDGEVQVGKLPPMIDYGIPFEFDYNGRLFEGKKGRVRPSPTPRSGPNWDEDQGDGDYPNNSYFYLPRMCNHCTKPACLEACPNDAIYKREEDGIVVIHLDKCKGTQACVQSCPYAKPYFNPLTNKSNKCIGCFPRIEKGVAPACVAQCVGRAMHVGFIDDTNSSVYKLVKQYKVALPLHPEFGTEPNVFYIPPVLGPKMELPDGTMSADPKIPLAQLEELFGKQVRDVMNILQAERMKKMEGKESELMDVLIGRRSADMMISPMT
ncbi:4Fe-4S dicluster domain-containing protein [Denitromonas ohlonensis]|uniref:4Fe-4S dicluster domain-containing protein n=2 Tax=Denitromonas TaxID=139331 RepID=A0A557SFG0_9RHOO|nr:4Fe-4S dicluster domain-containing protein [Denitromonas ohlonensis]TVT47617.1 MAG: 4Fe-4S dicluster domain-containing protein [Denitromonas halophila]TVO63320.1 4Fe-4S dicluster domain-containing protein [Denitromonas ohlonensis]TVO76133.1 4Fe-4S dicluster domain-containing protein [Denitromonas ohlonensis]TVT70050.1 MAG: 4Fe-4S dicluster domain-containing protein [Denitromonas halophila]TVT77520.1 MAG: 4Fe-4S dicluster domain-containing protein [Denitromonas halophila]